MNSEEILRNLMSKGKITQEDLFEADSHVQSPGRRIAITRIHLSCCDKNHDTGECTWYEEEKGNKDIIVIWSAPAHQKWVYKVLQIRKEFMLDWDTVDLLSRTLPTFDVEGLLPALSKLLGIKLETIDHS